MAKSGPRKIHRYSEEFKAQAVRLSALPGVEVQEVAHALAIHPFMLSRWRKQVRNGEIVVKRKSSGASKVEAELKELRKIKRKYKLLEEEHEALKKLIAWEAEQKRKRFRSSTLPKLDPTKRKPQ